MWKNIIEGHELCSQMALGLSLGSAFYKLHDSEFVDLVIIADIYGKAIMSRISGDGERA